MTSNNDRHGIPTLRDVACPGDELALRGLWLPVQQDTVPSPPRRPDLGDWQSRLPEPLREQGPQMLELVLHRARKRNRRD
jgi:hypothetical protein